MLKNYKKFGLILIIISLLLSGCTSSGLYIFTSWFAGEVRESSVLHQPIMGVKVLNTEGDLLGETDEHGLFLVKTSVDNGVAKLIFQHPNYEDSIIEQFVDGSKSQTVQLSPLELNPAGGLITGQVIREINLSESLPQNSFKSLQVNEKALEEQIIEGEYNLITQKGEKWVQEKLSGKGRILYASDSGFYAIILDSDVDAERWVEELTLTGEVEYIALNSMVQMMGQEYGDSDWEWADLWNMQMMDINLAWQHSTGSGVVVAVLDTLYTSLHPDLLPNLLPALDTTGNNKENELLNRHGLHVAGIIGALANRQGVVGIAPDVSILPIRVFNVLENSSIAYIVEALDLAIENQVDVINMSFGTANDDFVLHEAIKRAYEAGIVLVGASGNYGYDSLLYPAAYPEVIAVGAVGPDGERAYYSQYGLGLELMAPGGNVRLGNEAQILSTGWEREAEDYAYVYQQGTSMAAPHVSGIAALLVAYGINDPDYLRLVLRDTARDLGTQGYDLSTGYGLVDPYMALDRFQHTYVFFGSIEDGSAQLRSPVIQVAVNGEYNLSGVHTGTGRVIGWIDVNHNLIIDSGDYFGESEEFMVTSDVDMISEIDIQVKFIEGDFHAINIGVAF
ncbi:MAG: S8 family serine peptidase [Halanaerobiales bacterium]|nr:S8 family serine peptidase [Halanaerobiales bacterium]